MNRIQLHLCDPLPLTSARFDCFFPGGRYRIPDSKKTIWAKRQVHSETLHTFTMYPRDERFWFAGTPKAYVKGQLEANGEETLLTASFVYPVSLYICYLFIAVLVFALRIPLPGLVFLAIPTVEILAYNSIMKEELLKTLLLIFEEQKDSSGKDDRNDSQS